jgi:hypothetical protein
MGPLLPWAGLLAGVAGLAIAILNAFTGKDGRRAEAAAKTAESAKDKAEATAREHATWFDEADAAYKRIDKECRNCSDKLERLNGRFYQLIDALDDLCQNAQNGAVTVAELRMVVRAARTEPGRNHGSPS